MPGSTYKGNFMSLSPILSLCPTRTRGCTSSSTQDTGIPCQSITSSRPPLKSTREYTVETTSWHTLALNTRFIIRICAHVTASEPPTWVAGG
jgi:hypothetical protein